MGATSEAQETRVSTKLSRNEEEVATTNETTPEAQKSQGARQEEVATTNVTKEKEVTTTTTEAQNTQVAEIAATTAATDENTDFEEHLRSINTETDSAKKKQTKCTKKRKAERKE